MDLSLGKSLGKSLAYSLTLTRGGRSIRVMDLAEIVTTNLFGHKMKENHGPFVKWALDI